MKRGVLLPLFLFLIPLVAAESFQSSETLVIVLVSSAIIILVFVAFLIYITVSKKKYRPLGMQELIAKYKMIKPDNDKYRLSLFIKDAHIYEHSFQEIKENLVALGWSEQDVNQSCNDVMLDEFILSKISSGRTKQQIEEALLQNGWPANTISASFERCRVF